MNCFGVELGDPEPHCRNQGIISIQIQMHLNCRQDTGKALILFCFLTSLNIWKILRSSCMTYKGKFENAKHLVITVPARQELWTNYDVFNGHFKRYNLTDLEGFVRSRYCNYLKPVISTICCILCSGCMPVL